MSVPKCTSWRGHKFEARYSIDNGPVERMFNASAQIEMSDDVAKSLANKTYECDVCVRCGARVDKERTNA